MKNIFLSLFIILALIFSINVQAFISKPLSLSLLVVSIAFESSPNSSDGSITIEVNGGSLPYEYEWTYNGVFFSNEQNLSGLASGEYIVHIEDNSGCEITSETIILQTTVGINNTSPIEGLIEAFPNPTDDFLQLNVAFNRSEDMQILIYDITGKILLNQLKTDIQEASFDLDLSDWVKGIYAIKVIVEDKAWVEKIILQ